MKIGIIGSGLMAQGISKFFEKNNIEIEAISARAILNNKHAFEDVSFILESTNEDLSKKVAVIKKIETNKRIYTNTSSLCLDELRKESGRNDLGLIHFMNPANRNEVVEVIDVDPDIIDLLNKLGKDIYPVPNIPGFIVNRLLFAQIKEAEYLKGLGLSEVYIDTLYKNATKSRVGPFEVKRFVGESVSCKIIKNIWGEHAD